jgi:hypothetical protein
MYFVRWAFVLLGVAGCAGRLLPDEDLLLPAIDSGSDAPRTTTTGGPDPGTVVDPCIVDTGALRSCQSQGCHTPDRVAGLSAGLDLSVASVTTNAKSFLNRPNVGTMGVTTFGDPTGCPPGSFKLIDSENPMNSLLYTKTEAPGSPPSHPCGGKMPVIGTFTPDHKACILRWIQSVVALR